MIHMNGTSKDSLLDGVCKAGQAVRAAIDALAEAAPNQQDYYIARDPARAWRDAMDRYNCQAVALRKLYLELEEQAEHIADQD